MGFDWPTSEQVLYRVMRLRRLIAACVALPTVVLLIATVTNPEVLTAQNATIAILSITALVVGHVVLFPNVTLETISLSLSATLLILFMPVIRHVASWAPEEHVTAALILLTAFGVIATGVLCLLIQIVLNVMTYAGPALKRPILAEAELPCSPNVARRQCALQPSTRRGRVLTGDVDSNGFFDVAVATPQYVDPANADLPLVVRVDAKVLESTDDRHDVMLVMRNGVVTVTSQTFTQTATGCLLKVKDLPGDFTFGMHLLFWLTDQQSDHLTEMHDVIAGNAERANGLAHGVSLMSVAGTVLSPRAPATRQMD
ncbi:MAG: hypothetical protein AAGF56_01100 [Pseudomonadota bacterium]